MSKNYATGHSFSAKDLFYRFPVRKLKMSNQQCLEVYSDGHKRKLAEQIFIKSVQLIVDDIIDNNIHFKLPRTGPNQNYIYMNRVYGDEFKKAFKNGKWRDVDFITSDFSGYQLVLDMQSVKRLNKKKPIYLSSKYKQKITDNTNSGKSY